MTKICPYCLQEFETEYETKVCCCETHARNYRKKRRRLKRNPMIQIPCLVCGKDCLRATRGAGGNKPKTCGSKGCVRVWKLKCKTALNSKYRLEGKIWASSYNYGKYSAHVVLYRARQRILISQYTKAIKEESVCICTMFNQSTPYVCKVCGKEFHHIRAKSFCSNACGERAKFLRNPMLYFVRKSLHHMARRLKHRQGKINSYTKSAQCLPYNSAQFKERIESTWTDDMSWSNYGQWHIDHIRPCSSYRITDQASINTCFALNNLRALWGTTKIARLHGNMGEGNVNKGNKFRLTAE